ncbi:cupin domain-containing protein [Plantibacter sp. Mn2098]|uniref:cupin domain-containing protein n=1 Tax=Plantibacter sp. Mn2098 TaxID=3395266 RepID=UPI003BE62E58
MSDGVELDGAEPGDAELGDAEVFDRRTVDGELIERVRRSPTAAALSLEPHPEGGWYRRTWTSPDAVTVDSGSDDSGPDDGDGGSVVRPAATLIHFFLPPGESSAWHRVRSTEIWLWHGPGRITLQHGGSGEAPVPGESVVLGPDIAGGEVAQATVEPTVWQRTLPAEEDALASCLVSPGFDFADFTLA